MYQLNPLLEHSGIHPGMMEIIDKIVEKYPTSKDLAKALRKFSDEKGGDSRLLKFAELFDKDMDQKQYERYLTQMIPLRKFRMFLTYLLTALSTQLAVQLPALYVGNKVGGGVGAGIAAGVSAPVGFAAGIKTGSKIHDWYLNRERNRLINKNVDDILKNK